MAEITITKDNFEAQVLQSQEPILVDFWATWCGPCMMLAPTIEEIARENEGAIKVGKINVDENPELVSRFGITSIPVLMVMEKGQIVNKAVGAMPKKSILNLL